MTKSEEIEIVNKAKEDISELTPLIEKYYDPIYRYIFFRVSDKTTTEDLTADVFRNVVKSLDSFKDKGYGFSAWVYRIAHNRVLNYYRSSSKNKSFSLEGSERVFASDDDIEQSLLDKEEVNAQKRIEKRVLDLIDELDEMDKLVITLKYFENKDAQYIADAINTTPGNARVRLHRALKKLKSLYEDRYEEELEYEEEI